MTGTRFEMGATKERPILVLQQKVRLDTKVLPALRNYEKKHSQSYKQETV